MKRKAKILIGIMNLLFLMAAAVPVSGCSRKDIANSRNEDMPLVGGFTKEHAISKEEMDIFNRAYKGKTVLKPVLVATQVVAGTNYRYICKDKKGDMYEVVIYQKLPAYGGEESVTSVTKK